MQQLSEVVVSIWKVERGMELRARPDIPYLANVGIYLFLKGLAGLLDKAIKVINKLGALLIFHVPEHDHFQLLARVMRPDVL